MARSEKAVVTVLCLIYNNNKILLQDRVRDDWRGMTLPGGHVEKAESFVDAVIREMKEETGLNIHNPRLCGLKQFQTEEDERYIVVLFKTNEYDGELASSEEGEMHWVERTDLSSVNLVEDFMELLKVFDENELTEFQYETSDNEKEWKVRLV